MDAWGNWWPAGEWNASGIYQDYPASRRQIWEASVWFNPVIAPSGVAYAAVNISFLNAATQTIYVGTSAERITSATPTGQWVQLKVHARATLNTAFVRVESSRFPA